jgi:hypothetical protein
MPGAPLIDGQFGVGAKPPKKKPASNSFTDFYSGLLPKGHKKKHGSAIPIAPKPQHHYTSSGGSKGPGSSSSSSSSGSSSSGGSSGGGGHASSGGGGGGGGGMSGAEKRAIHRENAAKNKAANRYRQQSLTLEGQAAALQHALKYDFKKSLRTRLANVSSILIDQQKLLNEGYLQRINVLKGTVADNEKAVSGQSAINAQNVARERNSAVAEAMTHGAGESDVLQSQIMALRNWQANQTEVTRNYFDTLRSANSSRADLNVDTRTALTTNEIQSNADKEQLWTNYFNQRSETLTNLGNTRGQQADYLAQAGEMSKKAGKGMKQKKNQAKAAFAASAKVSGQAWKNPGVSDKVQNWQGEGEFEPTTRNDSKLEAARTVSLSKRPEGATLRKW